MRARTSPVRVSGTKQGDTVIVAGTFSKSFSPGIRVGWGILPRHLIGPVNEQKGNVDFGSPNLNQHLMARVLELGLLEPHLARIRSSYREKLTAMLAAADAHLAPLPGVEWLRPQGGLYVWVRLPDGMDAGLHGRCSTPRCGKACCTCRGSTVTPPRASRCSGIRCG